METNPGDDIDLVGNEIRLPFRPFEIKTLRIAL